MICGTCFDKSLLLTSYFCFGNSADFMRVPTHNFMWSMCIYCVLGIYYTLLVSDRAGHNTEPCCGTFMQLAQIHFTRGEQGLPFHNFTAFWPFHNSQRIFYHFHIYNFLDRNGSKNIPISQFSNFPTTFCLISQFTTCVRPFSQITASFQFTISNFVPPFSI